MCTGIEIGFLFQAIGAASAVAGTVTSMKGQKDAAAASKKAEMARKQQMQLDARRQQREIIRRSLVAQGQARANAANQGAYYSSGLQGGLGQIAGQMGRDSVANTQNADIGNTIFNANADQAEARGYAAIGSGITDMGKMFFQQGPALGRMFGQTPTRGP